MVRATIMSGHHRFKFYHNYKKKKEKKINFGLAKAISNT
jgi:hypothetical protein